jgi:hypothetical protein
MRPTEMGGSSLDMVLVGYCMCTDLRREMGKLKLKLLSRVM